MTINGNQIQAVVAMGVARQTAEKALATGATTDNIPEGTVNLYFTTARGRNVLAANTPLSYNNTTGTFSIQQGNGAQNGYISSSDWNTFNNKQPAGNYITSVTSNAPLSGLGTSTNHLIISKSSSVDDGYISAEDWNTFNGKANAFIGYTGFVVVVTGVNFVAQTVTTQTLTYSNGILTGVA